MFRASVRAAGVAALFGASVLCLPLARAGDCRGWTPKKSQRETLHPADCNFGYYGTAWRAWPEDCNRGYGCANQFAPSNHFAPTLPPPMWSPSMAPPPNMPAQSWPIQPQPESQNPWSTLPPIPQTAPPTWGPQLPPPTYGPAPTWSPPLPATPQYPTTTPPPLPLAPPATQSSPNNSAPPLGQRVPVPPIPTTMAPTRGMNSAVVPAGGWNRSVPATLSAPEFGPATIQPMSYSVPVRAGNTVPKKLIEPAPRQRSPVTLLAPEF